MIHAIQTLRQERRRLADRMLELTTTQLPIPCDVGRGVLADLIDDVFNQIADLDRALERLSPPLRRRAAA